MHIDTCVKDNMAIKLGITKAYDRPEWSFLAEVMCELGFWTHWIELVMKCVKFASFSFLVNGVPAGYVIPNRGLRQGDLISIFILIRFWGLFGFLKGSVERW